jgi:thioredoxin-like negative regulator of GroEL
VSLSNLSAVEFELGNYVGCSFFSQKALALLDAQENKQEAMQQKVYMRLAKAYIHSRKTDEAASILSKISPGEARGALERSVSAIQRLRKSFPDEKALRKLLLDRVSRYRPYL